MSSATILYGAVKVKSHCICIFVIAFFKNLYDIRYRSLQQWTENELCCRLMTLIVAAIP